MQEEDNGLIALLCSEPFRLFFPAGILISVMGVGLWPALYGGLISFPPAIPHARVMIEGFFSCFVIGFLGTALPRMMGAPRLGLAEFLFLLLLQLATAGAHLTGRIALGDGCFLLLITGFLVVMGARFCFLRREPPPAGFLLAAMGLLGAAAAVVLFLVEHVVPSSTIRQLLAQSLLYQGFLLFPILGVGSVLFPRFLGATDWKEDSSQTAGAVKALGCGLLLWTSFILEAAGRVVEGRLLRVACVAAYLFLEAGLFARAKEGGTLLFGLRAGVTIVILGYLVGACFPEFRKGMDHLVFIGGFGLIALSVASRVILGHRGMIAAAQGRSRPMQWVIWIVILGALTRASADPLPHIAVSHHIYAAISWSIAVVIWAVWVSRAKARDR